MFDLCKEFNETRAPAVWSQDVVDSAHPAKSGSKK